MALEGWAALILAAGGSRRFGAPKLLADLAGQPVIMRTVEGVISAGFDDVVVVAGAHCDAIAPILEGLRVKLARAAGEAQGLSASIGAGIAACPAPKKGLFVFLGDMPLVPFAQCAPLAGMARSSGFASRPRHDGTPGHPVCFVSAALAELAGLSGDQGAGQILKAREREIGYLEIDDIGAILDIDTPEDLARAQRLWKSRFTSDTIDKAISPGDFPNP